MTETKTYPVGAMVGFDISVSNATELRDFYASVIGWQSDPFAMDGYDDYFMKSPETGDIAAGICHARGANADLPPRWLAYIVVADLQASMKRCLELGGAILHERKGCEGESQFSVIRDPAGAVLALMQMA